MSADADADRPVVLTTAGSTFEADTIVVLLTDAGIPAHAEPTHVLPVGTGLKRITDRVPVQVRAGDLEAARRLVSERLADSDQLDWDGVELGPREDALPLHQPGRMPWLARVALAVALLAVALGVLGALATVILSPGSGGTGSP